MTRQPAKGEQDLTISSSNDSESESDNNVEELQSDDQAPDNSQEEPGRKQKGRGWPAFKTIDVQPEHPLYGVDKPASLKLHSVAIIVPSTPICPDPRPNPLTPAWKQVVRNFAARMLPVYRPWDSKHNLLRSLTWKDFCESSS